MEGTAEAEAEADDVAVGESEGYDASAEALADELAVADCDDAAEKDATAL